MCTVSINSELNGIEISFESKPSETVLAKMKEAGFRWHRQKKLWYAKNTAERMALAQKISGGEISAETVSENAAAAAPAEPVSRFGIKVGDILYDTWGYEQTNVEFYKVEKILSPCRVEIVKIGDTEVETDSWASGKVMPDPDCEIDEPIVKTVSQGSWERENNQWHIKINSSVSLSPWNGQPVFYSSWC